ncbi:glycosyltransferase, partial [Thermodesulfobacteriota bacterium]
AYTDADHSVDLRQLGLLLKPALREGAEVVIGSRRMKGSVVSNRTTRERLTSTVYNRLVRTIHPLLKKCDVRDTQCGFKLFGREVLETILSKERVDNYWSFDSEWLLLAHLAGRRIVEVPVVWVGSREESKMVLSDIWIMLKGLMAQRGHLKRISRRSGSV